MTAIKADDATVAQPTPETSPQAQREQLGQAERNAHPDQPKDYDQQATQRKIVSTGQDEQNRPGAIQNLDNRPDDAQADRSDRTDESGQGSEK